MDEKELTDRLNEIVERFCERKPTTLLGSFSPPFDTSKPNQHDSKKEFLAEWQLVEKAILNAEELFETLTLRYKDEHRLSDVSKTLCALIDREAKSSLPRGEIETPIDLVIRNSTDVGITFILIFLLLDLKTELNKRKQELTDQEAEFWSGNSRPPNHYARTIALRFARYVAKGTGKRPTVGTSRDGGHPSTDFGRALEEIFQLLEIKSDFRRAATWAVEQLTDDDFLPPANALAAFGGLGGFGGISAPNRLMGLMEAGSELLKKGETE